MTFIVFLIVLMFILDVIKREFFWPSILPWYRAVLRLSGNKLTLIVLARENAYYNETLGTKCECQLLGCQCLSTTQPLTATSHQIGTHPGAS